MKAKLIKEAGGYDLYRVDEDGKRVTFASTQDYKQKLSLKNCQAIESGYDLDELAENYAKGKSSSEVFQKAHRRDFIEGAKAILELIGDKKFSEKDMRKAIEIARNGSMQEQHNGYGRPTELRFVLDNLPSNDIIQSLQQTEWDVEIEMSCVIGCENLILNSENSLCCGNKQPKLDADGCLILKLKSE